MAQPKLLAASISRQHSGGFSVGVQTEVGDWHLDSKISRKRTKTAVTMDSCVRMELFGSKNSSLEKRKSYIYNDITLPCIGIFCPMA